MMNHILSTSIVGLDTEHYEVESAAASASGSRAAGRLCGRELGLVQIAVPPVAGGFEARIYLVDPLQDSMVRVIELASVTKVMHDAREVGDCDRQRREGSGLAAVDAHQQRIWHCESA